MVAFVGARQRDTVAVVGCTTIDPHPFVQRIWESSERVDPVEVAAELRELWARFSVRELLSPSTIGPGCSSSSPTKASRSQRFPGAPSGSVCSGRRSSTRSPTERRLTHAPDPVLARHVSNLGLISGLSGLRPDLDVGEAQPIATALACMIAYDGVTRIEPIEPPMFVAL